MSFTILAILSVQVVPATGQTPRSSVDAMTSADRTFHELNRAGRWAAALEHAQHHLTRASTCEDSIRWQADMAIATTRVGLRHDALLLVYRTLEAPCPDKLGGHHFELAMAAGESYLALAKPDSAMHFASLALEASQVLDLSASLDAASLIAEIAGCDGGLKKWARVRDSLRPQIDAARDSAALFDLRNLDYHLLRRLHECTPGRKVSTDSLLALIDGLANLAASLGRDPEYVAGFVYLKVDVLMGTGRRGEAIRLLEEAARAAAQPGSAISPEGQVALLSMLAQEEIIAGELVDAIEHSRVAVELARNSDEVLVQTSALQAHGEALLLAGHTREAEEHLREAEKLILTLGLDRFLASQAQVESPLLGSWLQPLETFLHVNEAMAQIAVRSGDYRGGEARFRRGFELSAAVGDSAAMQRSLMALASARLLQGDSIGARRLEEQATDLDVVSKRPTGLADPYETWKVTIDFAAESPDRRQAAWEASDRLLKEGLAERAPSLAADLRYQRAFSLLPRYAQTRDTTLLSTIIDEARRAAVLLEALPATQTLQFSYALLGTAFEEQAIALGNLGASSEKLAEAARYRHLAVETATELGHPALRARSLSALAVVESYRGNSAAADSVFRLALRAAEDSRFLLLRDDGVRSRYVTIGALGTLYVDAIRYYVSQGRLIDAFVVAELAKSRGLSDLVMQRSAIEEADATGSSIDGVESSEIEIGIITEELRRNVEEDVRRRTHADSIFQSAFRASLESTLGPRALAALFADSDVAILSFFVDPLSGAVYTWLIGDGTITGYAPESSRQVLDLTEELVGQIHRSSPSRFGRGPAPADTEPALEAVKELPNALLGSLDSLLSRSTARTLVVIPDGPLSLVPFAALPVGDALLGERFSVIVLPALHLARFEQSTSDAASTGRFLGVADPSGSLPRAEAEVRSAARYFARAEVLTRDTATVEAVLEAWNGASVIHFATHAVAIDSAPNVGHISLAPGSTSDGRLSVSEVLDTSDLNAELVVLSACETGGGMVLEGEGIMGFGRAFLAAGAERVLVTLWPVDDRVAEYFMERFYRNWRRDGLTIAQAFGRAQSATRDRYPALHDWAAFRLIAKNW